MQDGAVRDGQGASVERELRAWRRDHVAGAVTLIMTVVLATVFAVSPDLGGWWGWVVYAPTLFALVMVVVSFVAQRRSRSARGGVLAPVGFTRLGRVQADLNGGTVRDADCEVAVALVLRDGAWLRIQGWVSLGLGAGQAGTATLGGSLWGVSVGVAVVMLGVSAMGFHQLGVHSRQSAQLLRGSS